MIPKATHVNTSCGLLALQLRNENVAEAPLKKGPKTTNAALTHYFIHFFIHLFFDYPRARSHVRLFMFIFSKAIFFHHVALPDRPS